MKVGAKSSFNLQKKKKSEKKRRKSFDENDQNEFKKPVKKVKAVDKMLARDLKYLLDF